MTNRDDDTRKSVLLFNSPIVKHKRDQLEMGNLYPRIGIASIASTLLRNGVEVGIVDPEIEDLPDIINRIHKFKPDIVGIPAYTEEIHDAAYTSATIKKIDGEILTVIGGPHSSAIPIETLKEFDSFDIAVMGEGELTMLDIVLKKNIADVAGIAYRDNGQIKCTEKRPVISNLDALPYPAWELFDIEKYRGGNILSGFSGKGKSLEIPVESARGCPYKCIFCYRVNGREIRFKSPKRTVDEVEKCVTEFNATKIHFVEGTFGVNKKNAIEMCDELIRRGLNKKITWSSGGRVNVLDRKLLMKMKESGCEYLGFGVESGDQAILDKIGKGITIAQIIKVFELCKDVGIKTEANFIIGHPDDTEETVLKTIKFAKKLNTDHVTFAILVPFPGTKVTEMAEDNVNGLKIVTKDWRLYGKQLGYALELEDLPYKKLVKLQTKAYREFYFRPSKLLGFVSRLSLKRVIYVIKRVAGY